MTGSFIELIATTEDELKEADKIAANGSARTIYVMPGLIQIAGVARSLSNGKYKIIIMVDYPKGSHYGMDKFKGTPTDFFLADGYDIILTPGRTPTEVENEIKIVNSFIKTMISQHSMVCYTINASMRNQAEIEACARAFSSSPPGLIKLEASTTVQPTKANLEVHKNTIKLIRNSCTSPIAVCGNVTYGIYKEFSSIHKIVASPEQYRVMKKQEETENETKLLNAVKRNGV